MRYLFELLAILFMIVFSITMILESSAFANGWMVLLIINVALFFTIIAYSIWGGKR